MGFVNWNLSIFHSVHFILINMYTDYIIPCFCKTSSCNQTYVSCSYNCYVLHLSIKSFTAAQIYSSCSSSSSVCIGKEKTLEVNQSVLSKLPLDVSNVANIFCL